MRLYIKNQKFDHTTVFSDVEQKLGIKGEIACSHLKYDRILFTEERYLNEFGLTYPTIEVYDNDACSSYFYININADPTSFANYAGSLICRAFAQLYFNYDDRHSDYFEVDYIENIFPCYMEFCKKGLNSALIEMNPQVATEVELDPVIYATSNLVDIRKKLIGKQLIERDSVAPFFAQKYAENLLH